MKLSEKVFELGSASGRDVSKLDHLLVVINDTRTELKVVDLFESGFQLKNSSFKGHSILSLFEVDDKSLRLKNKHYNISLFSVVNQEDMVVTKVRNPVIQDNDVTIGEEELKLFYAKLDDAFDAAKPEVEDEQVIIPDETITEEITTEEKTDLSTEGVIEEEVSPELKEALNYLNDNNIAYLDKNDDEVIALYNELISKAE